jgi:hypothetical protein
LALQKHISPLPILIEWCSIIAFTSSLNKIPG